jgi:DNA repair exonuclease SbcCD ATPase subunit
LAAQDTRTPLINAIYEQITRGAAGYDDLVDCGDITYDHVEGQVIADGSLRNPDLAHDEIPEEYRLRLQKIYNQFVDSQNFFREQLDRSRAQQQELHADLLAAERERERLESKRQGAKVRCAEAEVIVSKLRADLSAAMEHLDRQTEVASSKDDIIQSVTEKSQVAHVRLKYAEDKITHLNAKLQSERDRRHRKTKELLDEQVRAQDRHESEIRRLKQEAKDAQEQLDSLRSTMSELHADGRSPLDHDHSALYRDHWVALEKLFTWMRQGECDTCQPPLPPEHIYDTDGPPISPAANVDSESSPLSTKRDHWVALEELFGWMRQEEYESAQDAVKPNEEQESQSRLQDELAATKEQLCLVEEEYLSVRCDINQSREALREVKSHVVSLQFEWEMCKALVREAQEARRSSLTELTEVIELLRVSQAEWEESQFRCSQVTFLCGALQERVTELEAKAKKGLKKYPVITPGHINSEYRSRCPRDGTGMCAHPIYAVL